MNFINFDLLRTVFTISVGAFDFARTIKEATGSKFEVTEMEALHRTALMELQKEAPNSEVIDMLLGRMEDTAIKNKANEKVQT